MYLNNMAAAAGVIPGKFLASPMFSGFFFVKISIISFDKPEHSEKFVFWLSLSFSSFFSSFISKSCLFEYLE